MESGRQDRVVTADCRRRKASCKPAGVGPVDLLGTEPSLVSRTWPSSATRAWAQVRWPPDRARLAEGSDVLEPALEQLGHRDRPLERRTAVLDLDHEAGQLGLGLALAALEEAPDLDWLARRVTAEVDPQLPCSWATLSNGAFACHVVFLAFLVLQRVPRAL